MPQTLAGSRKRKVFTFWEVFLTMTAWGFLALLAGWVLAALGWYLLALVWYRELFVPRAVRDTALAVAILTLWALGIGFCARLWSLYNRRRYYCHNRRRLDLLPLKVPRLSWMEATLIPPCPAVNAPTEVVASRVERPLFVRPHSPASLLSSAALLETEGRITEAAGLLRLLLENSEVPLLVREVASLRLARLLAMLKRERLALFYANLTAHNWRQERHGTREGSRHI